MNIDNPEHHLPIDLEKFGFVEREKIGWRTIKNRCGRDFFYYVLSFFYPQEFNPNRLNPRTIEKTKFFGHKTGTWFVWTGLSFTKLIKVFQVSGLELTVNGRRILGFRSLLLGALYFPKRLEFQRAKQLIKENIKKGHCVGLDVSLALGGIVDHVMFVWGYDDTNVYVFDTHKVPKLEYKKMTSFHDPRYIMKMPWSVVQKRWNGLINRVWVINKSGA